MKLRPALYQCEQSDNVAVALGNLHVGQRVPLLSSEGRQIAEITMQADVPAFFKTAIRLLHDGEAIIKHSKTIGVTVARTYQPLSSLEAARELSSVVPTGSPVHLTNFIPSTALADLWDGNLAQMFGSCCPAYEFGTATKKISTGQDIYHNHVRINPHIVAMTDGLIGRNPVLGRAIVPIAEGALVRLGCIAPSEYEFNGNPKKVDAIAEIYRFFKGRLYETP